MVVFSYYIHNDNVVFRILLTRKPNRTIVYPDEKREPLDIFLNKVLLRFYSDFHKRVAAEPGVLPGRNWVCSIPAIRIQMYGGLHCRVTFQRCDDVAPLQLKGKAVE